MVKDIQKMLESDGNTLAEIVGVYTPAFMQIRLSFPFDGEFSHLEPWQKGTYLHEYVHYLQNISTPFGLLRSLLVYWNMTDMFAYLHTLSADTVVQLPVSFSLDKKKETEWKRHLLFSRGCTFRELPSKEIAPGEKIGIDIKNIVYNQHNYEIVELNLMLSDGQRYNVILGGDIIMESMAAMCQHMIDPNSTHQGIDIPYNLVKLLCQQHYPSIAADESKLVVLCYISLFSMNPGLALIEQLDYAEHNPNASGEDILNRFVMQNSIIVKGARKGVIEFFDSMVDDFKSLLSKTIQCPLDSIGEALERVKLSNAIPPFVAAFADGIIDDEKFGQLSGYYGTPYIYSIEEKWYKYPESLKNPGQESQDMIALIGYHALFNYLSNKGHQCPLCFLDCSLKPECKQTPWEGNPCPVQVMAQALQIDKLKLAP